MNDKPHYPQSGELTKRLAIVAANGCTADQGADALVNLVVNADGADLKLSGSLRNPQHCKAPPAWFAERERVEAIIAQVERDAGVTIADALGQAKL